MAVIAPSRRRLLGTAAAVSVLAALAACDRIGRGGAAATRFNGVDITGTGMAGTLALADTDGRPRTLADFAGKVAVVFFGYTQCPDVCPTTLAALAQIKQSLGSAGDRLQVVFVTLDPERDTAAVLKSYMANFDPSFIALRGSVDETAAVAKEFKLYYAKVPSPRGAGAYTVDHTAGAFVYDPKGQARLFVRYGGETSALKQDIETLLAAG